MNREQGYQLPLFLDFNAPFTLEGFLGKKVDHILSMTGIILVCGIKASGKTHLVESLSKEAKRRGLKSHCIAADITCDLNSLYSIDEYDLVCVDDLHKVCGIREWEIALFHLANFMTDTQRKLILSSEKSPENLSFELKDLYSRIVSANRIYLRPFDDATRLDIMIKMAERKGFEISEEAAKFIISRCRRDMEEIARLVNEIEVETMRLHSKVTIPFLKKVLKV